MTEFRKASTVVEALEQLASALQSDASAAQESGQLSPEGRARWSESQSHLQEVNPVAEKMRRRVQARSELETVKVQLQELLPGAPSAEAVKAAQELVDKKGEGYEAVEKLLSQALELEVVATYGVKMAEKVSDLLNRLDAVQQALATCKPILLPLVQHLEHEQAASEAAQRREEEAASQAAAAAAAEEARRPVEALMEENQRRMEAQRAAEEAERRRLEEERRAEQEAEANRLASEDALLRMEKECDAKLARLGANGSCAEALASMLAAAVGAYREVVEGLQNMVTAIASEPADVRLRLIRIGNEGFQQKLGRQPGVWLFLRGLGFRALARESLPSDLVAALGLSSSGPTERFLMLAEPDMMSAYEDWNKWHKRLLAISGFLQSLEKLVFHRTAHLGRHGLDVVAGEVLSAKELLQSWESSVPD